MRKSYHYGAYRGRSHTRNILKILAIILAVLVIGVLITLAFLQQYIVYSAEGVKLELPFLQGQNKETSVVTPVPDASDPLVVVTPEVADSTDTLRAVMLDRAALYDGTATQQVTAAGANAAVFDMKADDGSLGYVSQLTEATKTGASDTNPALNAAISGLNATKDFYTIARVSCFRDGRTAKSDRALCLLTSRGGRWTDSGDLYWTSPASRTVCDYVTGVCRELAGLGFDEILLDHCAYPTDGNLDNIRTGDNYEAAAFSQTLSAFYSQVRSALAEYPEVKLSIMTDNTTLSSGTNPTSGQTLELVVGVADRVWTAASPASTAAWQTGLESAGLKNAAVNLVSVSTQAGTGDGSWAVLWHS
ncbi:MAG: putative glycoside hydrolase [Intestinimonas sp.]|jgi:hypothetical protein|nr:putative glycoside hydrolase [Intestinimonas sp.]